MYSLGFRQAAITLYNSIGNMKTVAKLLQIGLATIWRWLNQGIKPKPRKVANNTKATEQVQTILKTLLLAFPSITLFQLRSRIQESLGITLSRQCIARAIKLFGFSRKRATWRGIVNKKVLDSRIEHFKNHLSVLDKDSIVSVDELGFDYKTLPIYGYSPKGQKAVIRTNCTYRKRTNLIMAITSSGRFFVHIINGKVNGNIFAEFITDLSTRLGSTILMDNASIHKTNAVKEAMLGRNVKPLFIPPYSPDFNPIENVFSIIKRKVRSDQAFNPKDNPVKVIQRVLQNLDTKTFEKCFKRSYRFASFQINKN
jgi:transposase